MKRRVVSRTCHLVHEDRHSNSQPARLKQFRRWPLPKIIDMCQQADWRYSLSDSEKSSLHHQLGLGWYGCTNGVILVAEFTQPSPKLVFEPSFPMKFGTGDNIPDDLHIAKKEARESRMEVNRSISCPICEPVDQ